MPQPYEPRGKFYMPRSSRYAVNLRPSKASAGMSYTASRGGGAMKDESLRLAVFGTLDRTRSGIRSYTQRIACGCCGSRSAGRLALNDAGRVRLAALRRRRAASLP